MWAMRKILPFISPWPLATTAENDSRNSFTIFEESSPAGAFTAVSAAPGDEIAVAHLADEIKRRAERREQRGGGSVGRLALRRRLPLLAEIEVIARILGRFHTLPCTLAHGAVCQPGGNHQRLLRPTDDHVNPPTVDVEMGGAETSDRVDDEQRVVAILAHQLRDSLDVVARAGRTLGRLHENGA